MAYRHALAGLIALVLLAACSLGGGADVGNGGVGPDRGNGLTPFPTERTDELPSGTRIDVANKNLFQMSAGDTWTYTMLNAAGDRIGSLATRQVTADDGAGHVALLDDDGSSDTTDYTVSADGLLMPHPLGTTPAAMANIVGGIFEYATPLYPVGAVRRHVRSGPWGEDLDGDGKDESFRLEYTQVFLGFETVELSGRFSLVDVAHFHNVFKLTLRPTSEGTTESTITSTEDAWFAPNLGLLKAQRTTVDSDGTVIEQPHTILFSQGFVGGTSWNIFFPPPLPLDGTFIDVALTQNALVYDSVRNVYYASVPGSVVANGNRIATIDPTTGQVSYSAPVGSEPNVLALAADASTLYVGLDGSGDVVRLAPPAMTEQGRVHLPTDPTFGQATARAIAVSPTEASVAAVTLGSFLGVGLLRNMVLQPKRASVSMLNGSGFLVFDSAGDAVYSLNNQGPLALNRLQVLADGLADGTTAPLSPNSVGMQGLAFSNNRLIAGTSLYDRPLNALGVISGAQECVPRRSDALLVCLASQSFGGASVLLADPGTSVIGSALLTARSEPLNTGNRRIVEGPAGQVAIVYFNPSPTIRLFSSAKLLTPPTPVPAVWPVTSFSTQDGQGLDVAINHNAVVYDSVRNVYYASVPGSVIGSGNSIAVIDPASGQVAHSAPVGSEPKALALSADASVLYVGVNGSGEVVKLSLPSMGLLGRVRLPVAPFQGISHALALAVSPASAGVAAVVLDTAQGIGLIRDMILQPNKTSIFSTSSALAFDPTGATLYGVDSNGLRKMQVLADGLADQASASIQTGLAASVGVLDTRVIAGAVAFDASTLVQTGVVSGAEDCRIQRGGTLLLCLATLSTPPFQGRILVASSSTFVIGQSLVFADPDTLGTTRRLLQGPAGQVAVSYPALGFNVAKLRLFSSAQLP